MQRLHAYAQGALRLVFFVIVAALLASPVQVLAQKTLKKRVAVFTFEDRTDQQFGWFDARIHPGEGMADMLTTALVKSGKYRVIERKEIDEIFKEQKLGQGGNQQVADAVNDFFRYIMTGGEQGGDGGGGEVRTGTTAESAAQVGQLLGVELAVVGAVTEFGYGSGGVGGATSKLGVGVKSDKAVVAVDVRLIDTTTGEIVSADNVRKEEQKRGLSFRTNKLSFKNQNDFDESMVGKATRAAIEEIVELTDEYADSLPWQAKVVTMSGNNVIINAGSASGVNNGDRFVVMRAGEELIDPDTGLSLGSLESEIGEIQVVNNQMGGGKAAQCKVLSGGGMVRGDIIREK